jgi:colanic acid biosynthesis glycosyl transferase WcaI
VQILFINQFFWPDTAATGQLLTDVIRAIAPKNAHTRVLCGQPGYGAVETGAPPPVEIMRVGPAGFSRGKLRRILSYASYLIGAISKAIRSPHPDIVVTLTTPPLVSLLGTLLKSTRGSRHFIWEMDVYPDIATDLGVLAKHGIPARLIGAISDWSRRKADGIIVLGEDMKARLLARGIAEDRIHIAENWADGAEIVPQPFPEGPLVIHYSGNLGLAHETETVIGVLRNLGDDPRFRFIFAGGGARRARLQDFCRESGLRTVEFQSYTSRGGLGASLASGHLGLVTQLPETCGSVVPSKTYGIMAAGRPILYIGPRAGTPSRIIDAYGCGWQIDPGDVAGLTSLLTSLVADRNPMVEAGARARAAFERHYDRPIGISRIAAILGLAFTDLH